MNRYTRKNAEHAFERLVKLMGTPTGPIWSTVNGKNVAKVGALQLDYNPIYGGCIVEQICNEGGAVVHPFGELRLSPFEFCQAVRMVEGAMRLRAVTREAGEGNAK